MTGDVAQIDQKYNPRSSHLEPQFYPIHRSRRKRCRARRYGYCDTEIVSFRELFIPTFLQLNTNKCPSLQLWPSLRFAILYNYMISTDIVNYQHGLALDDLRLRDLISGNDFDFNKFQSIFHT